MLAIEDGDSLVSSYLYMIMCLAHFLKEPMRMLLKNGYYLHLWRDFIRNKPKYVLDIASGKLGAERSKSGSKLINFPVRCWAPAQPGWRPLRKLGARSGLLGGHSGS